MAINFGTLYERLADARIDGIDQLSTVRVVGPGGRKYEVVDVSIDPSDEGGSSATITIQRPADAAAEQERIEREAARQRAMEELMREGRLDDLIAERMNASQPAAAANDDPEQ